MNQCKIQFTRVLLAFKIQNIELFFLTHMNCYVRNLKLAIIKPFTYISIFEIYGICLDVYMDCAGIVGSNRAEGMDVRLF